MVNFSKYQGTGNDFIMIDNRNLVFYKNTDFIARLCHRRFGIGADGLILLENADKEDEDFRMIYFNADGKEGSMCGNGGRCIVKFAQDLGIVKTTTRFRAVDGIHEAEIKGDLIALKMNDISSFEKGENFFCIDSGSPHYITFVEDTDKVDVYQRGKAIRNSPAFVKEGINVNFVEADGPTHNIRTYERGVEDETYSCGTGVTASALALFLAQKAESPVKFETLGGNLEVSFESSPEGFTNIKLIGPAEKTFDGSFVQPKFQ